MSPEELWDWSYASARLQYRLNNPKRYRIDNDYEKDLAEYIEEMSLGGQQYDIR